MAYLRHGSAIGSVLDVLCGSPTLERDESGILVSIPHARPYPLPCAAVLLYDPDPAEATPHCTCLTVLFFLISLFSSWVLLVYLVSFL